MIYKCTCIWCGLIPCNVVVYIWHRCWRWHCWWGWCVSSRVRNANLSPFKRHLGTPLKWSVEPSWTPFSNYWNSKMKSETKYVLKQTHFIKIFNILRIWIFQLGGILNKLFQTLFQTWLRVNFIEVNDKQCIDDFFILSRYWLQNYDILNVIILLYRIYGTEVSWRIASQNPSSLKNWETESR